MTNYILHNTWYSDKMDSIDDGSKRIVSAAAELIRAQLLSTTYNTHMHPSEEDIKSTEHGSNLLPPLLLVMLKALVPNIKQQIY